jgi:hypothetical protein
MPNITISLDEEIIKSGRKYAREHQTSLNALIRKLLEENIGLKKQEAWADECFAVMDHAAADSGGQKWKREDLYDV